MDEEENLYNKILIIRDQKVMIDSDLAKLYGVSTKVLNQAVKRNLHRFPVDFMFKLALEEYKQLNRSQFVTGYQKHRDPRFLPYVFTEHGVGMLSAVLNSDQAIQMSIFIVRVFIKMRESLEQYKDLALKINKIEINQIHDHDAIKNIHNAVKHMLELPQKPKGKIGFVIRKKRKRNDK